MVALGNLFAIVFPLSTTLPYFGKISGPVYMEVGDPRYGEVTCLGGVTRLSI